MECLYPSWPEGLVLVVNPLFGNVKVPGLHSRPQGKTIELATAIFPRSTKILNQIPL